MNGSNKSLTYTPIPRIRRKKSVNAETNTDPWEPACQKCLEKNKLPELSFTNNCLDINQYVSAINYINSIHNSINESLSKQCNVKSSKANRHMTIPDLPNFLTILSAVHKSSTMISTKSTSTSSLQEKTNNQATNTKIDEAPNKVLNTNCWNDANSSNYSPTSRDMSVISLEEPISMPPTQIYQTSPEPKSDELTQFDISSHLQRNIYGIQSNKSYNSGNLLNRNDYTLKSSQDNKCIGSRTNEKDTTEYLLNTGDYCTIKKNKKTGVVDDVRGGDSVIATNDELLSDADIDHYASELLRNCNFNNRGERTTYSAPHPHKNQQPRVQEIKDTTKKKVAQKRKEKNEKEFTDNATTVKPIQRTKDKTDYIIGNHRESSPIVGETTSIVLHGSNSPTNSAPSSIECGLRIGNKIRSTKAALKTMLIPRTPMIDFCLGTSVKHNKRGSNKTAKMVNKGTVPLDFKNSVKGSLKKDSVYVIHQRDADDFMFPRRKEKAEKHSSESLISTNKVFLQHNSIAAFKERIGRKYVDSFSFQSSRCEQSRSQTSRAPGHNYFRFLICIQVHKKQSKQFLCK